MKSQQPQSGKSQLIFALSLSTTPSVEKLSKIYHVPCPVLFPSDGCAIILFIQESND